MTKKKIVEEETISKEDVGTVSEVLEIQVPEGLKQFLGQYTAEELATMLQDQMEKLTGKVAAANIVSLSIVGVINEVRKANRKAAFNAGKTFKEAEQVVGFIVGDGGLWDKIAMMRNTVQSYIKKNSVESAINNNKINGDGQILDQRKKIFGKENEGYLSPLKDNVTDCSRALYLIARINGDPTYKFGSINTNSAALARGWSKIRFAVPCSTFGIVKENNESGFKLNSSEAEETTSVFRAVKEDMDIAAIFDQVITPKLIEITAVEREYELTKEAWDRMVFVEGRVAWIARDRPTPFGAIKMGLMDDNGVEIVVQIPEQVPKDFGELSRVVVIGKPDRGDLKTVDEDTRKVSYLKGKGEVYIQAVGIFVKEGTPVDVMGSEALGEGKEIEGWVP